MKKKLLLSLMIGTLLLTGCGKSDEETGSKSVYKDKDGAILFRCGNGNVNEDTRYKEYRVKDTEILAFRSYFEKRYTTKNEMESKKAYYEKLDVYDVEVMSDTELRVLERNPKNTYALAKTKKTYEEMIKDYEEDGYFCQISSDGKTFERKVSDLSNEESERSGWKASLYTMEEYDSEVFYTDKDTITYKMISGYMTKGKSFSKLAADEEFINTPNDVSRIEVRVKDLDYYGYEEKGHKKGADSLSYRTRKHDLEYDERNKATEIKTVKIGDYQVYYYTIDDFAVVEAPIIYMFFNLDNYVIQIEGHYRLNIKYDNVKNNTPKYFEDLIKSFKMEKVK